MRALSRRGVWAAVLVGLVSLCAGCKLVRFEREAKELRRNFFFVYGEIEGVRSEHGVVLRAYQDLEEEGAAIQVVESAVSFVGSRYTVVLRQGVYWVLAFEDVNDDLELQEGERWTLAFGEDALEVTQDFPDTTLTLPVEARPLRELPFPPDAPQTEVGIESVGAVVALDDPRLSRHVGRLGFERPMQYFRETNPGIYFLEEFNPRKIPVLMVHGLDGSPVQFEALIRGRAGDGDEPGFRGLDPERYQPWLVSYPSSFPLRIVSQALQAWTRVLQQRHAPETVLVLAHSMGGLPARKLLNQQAGRTGGVHPKLMVSVATPWCGMRSAALGTKLSPVVVPSWRDVAAGSDFIQKLFATPLAPEDAFHLVFAYPLPSNPATVPSGDGTVPFGSLVCLPAMQQADGVHALEGSHAGILDSPELVATVSRLFDEALRAP